MSDEIASKLELLEEYVSYLREYQYYDMEDIMSDQTLKVQWNGI